MNNMIRQLNRDIFESLAAQPPGSVPGRRQVGELLKSPEWVEGIASLFPIRGRLTCARILEVCAPVLDKLCPQGPEKGWGLFCWW